MQALILAAGMGTRLGHYTERISKCMLSVGGISLIERAVTSIKNAGINRLIVVTGYKSNVLSSFIGERIKDIKIDFIDNPLYETTNNIYSLYLAQYEMVKYDTILLEADLIFDEDLILSLCQTPEENMAIVDHYNPSWMNGTVVKLHDGYKISSFIPKRKFDPAQTERYYKTVNIYKFSKEFSRDLFMPALFFEIENGNVNQYYETVLGKITEDSGPCLTAFLMNGREWYEIDDENDFNNAKKLFTKSME